MLKVKKKIDDNQRKLQKLFWRNFFYGVQKEEKTSPGLKKFELRIQWVTEKRKTYKNLFKIKKTI